MRIDPFFQQAAKVTGSGEISREEFGYSVALSADGNTALVGGPSSNYTYAGGAWVFTRSGATWTQQAKLISAEVTGFTGFGRSVALSADGNTAAIGAPLSGTESGAVWIFSRSGSAWTEQAKLKGSGATSDCCIDFGFSVALSADGNTVLIGAPRDNEVGAVWVFTRSGSSWTQQGEKLKGGEAIKFQEAFTGDFGYSVALSSDGNTALIGGANDNGRAGAAWVFTRSSSTWAQQGPKLPATRRRQPSVQRFARRRWEHRPDRRT